MGLYIAWRSGTNMGEIHFSTIKKIPSHPFPRLIHAEYAHGMIYKINSMRGMGLHLLFVIHFSFQ
jgi:hypothetical protein